MSFVTGKTPKTFKTVIHFSNVVDFNCRRYFSFSEEKRLAMTILAADLTTAREKLNTTLQWPSEHTKASNKQLLSRYFSTQRLL